MKLSQISEIGTGNISSRTENMRKKQGICKCVLSGDPVTLFLKGPWKGDCKD